MSETKRIELYSPAVDLPPSSLRWIYLVPKELVGMENDYLDNQKAWVIPTHYMKHAQLNVGAFVD